MRKKKRKGKKRKKEEKEWYLDWGQSMAVVPVAGSLIRYNIGPSWYSLVATTPSEGGSW